jgi:hypothetical protein
VMTGSGTSSMTGAEWNLWSLTAFTWAVPSGQKLKLGELEVQPSE